MGGARQVVREYLTAFADADFAAVERLVAEDFAYTGPITESVGRDAFLATATPLGPVLAGHRPLRQWEDGEEVCSIYALLIRSPVGSGEVVMAEWNRVRDGQVATARLLYDPAALLALLPAPET